MCFDILKIISIIYNKLYIIKYLFLFDLIQLAPRKPKRDSCIHSDRHRHHIFDGRQFGHDFLGPRTDSSGYGRLTRGLPSTSSVGVLLRESHRKTVFLSLQTFDNICNQILRSTRENLTRCFINFIF